MRADVSDEALVERACRRLDQMDFVGITEDFDAGFRQLELLLGQAPSPQIPHMNSSHGQAPPIDDETFDNIRQAVAADIAIYEHALTLYDGNQPRLSP